MDTKTQNAAEAIELLRKELRALKSDQSIVEMVNVLYREITSLKTDIRVLMDIIDDPQRLAAFVRVRKALKDLES